MPQKLAINNGKTAARTRRLRWATPWRAGGDYKNLGPIVQTGDKRAARGYRTAHTETNGSAPPDRPFRTAMRAPAMTATPKMPPLPGMPSMPMEAASWRMRTNDAVRRLQAQARAAQVPRLLEEHASPRRVIVTEAR